MRNKRNKIIKSICFLLILILAYFILYFYYAVVGNTKDLDTWARHNNTLNLERDFQIYSAIQEGNISRIKKNLELNFMFHLTASEQDGIRNVLDMSRINRICQLYDNINKDFKKNYIKKYPSVILDLETTCRDKNFIKSRGK